MSVRSNSDVCEWIKQLTTPSSFFLDDHGRTLFPLTTNRVLVEHGSKKIAEYIRNCFDINEPSYNYLPQERVYAAKQNLHLRRTAKLDAVAELYLYSVVHNHRALFRRPHRNERSNFGFRFENGNPISATIAYKAFRTAIAKYRKEYAYFLSFDVATYFNGIYHHDLHAWFRRLGAPAAESEQFGTFFRQISSGRSLDCLPHGLYPSKMIGNDFLRFIDDSLQIRSDQLLRFMDDFYLFSNNEETINQDFILIQRMLGEKGLSVNPKKTNYVVSGHVQLEQDIDEKKVFVR